MCVRNLHEDSEDTGPSLSKAGMKGHMPLLFRVTDEVDSWTHVVHSCLRCGFHQQHFHFLQLLVPVRSMDSQDSQTLLLIFASSNFT